MTETIKTQRGFVKRYFVPSLILVLICILVTAALAFTYQTTAPVIQKNSEEAERIAAEEVLGGQEGVALKSQVKSYGGKLEVMVGISLNGEVTGVKVLSHSDTPGLGTQAMTEEYLQQYIGLSGLNANHIDDDSRVEAITGATISSNAIYHAVAQALSDYQKTGGEEK